MDNHTYSTTNQKTARNFLIFFAGAVILSVIVYSEIMFLQIVGSVFPNGIAAVAASMGAVATGVSIFLLFIGKLRWFRPGAQEWVAWGAMIAEMAILIMNDILVFEMHNNNVDAFMAIWKEICPAAPVVSLVVWVLIFFFDPANQHRHKMMEMEDSQANAQIDFKSKMHARTMILQNKAADMALKKFEEKIETKLEYHLDTAAAKYAARVASELTGEQVSHTELIGIRETPKQLPPAKVVEADPPPTKAASRDHVVDPHGVKPQVDNEKKSLKQKLLDFSLPKGVAGKKKIDDTELISPDEELEEEQQVEEEETTPKTETDLMAMNIDDRWREYSNLEDSQPQKKRGRKRAKQED